MRKKIIFALIAVFILSGFTRLPEIKDLRDISQDHRTFTERQAQEFSRLDFELQKKADAFHNERFFSPWHQEASRYKVDEVKWEFDKYAKDLGYGRNARKHSRSWIKKLRANADLEDYPQGGLPAITIQNTDLRVLPTADAHLSSPGTCPLPFDNLQNSGVAANTPLFVSHIAKDKKWVLAETHYALGWIPAAHIAYTDESFMKLWEKGAYITIIKDKTPIYDNKGGLLFRASLGSFFPKTGDDEKNLQILIATADKRGKASIGKFALSKEAAAVKPLKLTAANMAMIANSLMNEPYGWGGLGQKRDCSSTLMDLFAPFGVWLPRNSGQQAKRTGAFLNLRDLSPEEKEKTIIRQGLPYFTLLWLKGHIMLYIGHQNGRALVFHNFWKVKTIDAKGKEGRKIIGRAAITTLRPGQELRPGGKDSGDTLPSILGMTLLWPPPLSPVISPPGEED